MLLPCRGEIWRVNLNPSRGHEQAGIRPALIVSVDMFNHGPAAFPRRASMPYLQLPAGYWSPRRFEFEA
jgi:hypothetical protein